MVVCLRLCWSEARGRGGVRTRRGWGGKEYLIMNVAIIYLVNAGVPMGVVFSWGN